jgi:hypothetical protein
MTAFIRAAREAIWIADAHHRDAVSKTFQRIFGWAQKPVGELNLR